MNTNLQPGHSQTVRLNARFARLGFLLIALALSAVLPVQAQESLIAPRAGFPQKIEGPIIGGEHGWPFAAAPSELMEVNGYIEEEYFISGQTYSYMPVGELADDGMWDVVRREKALDYKTRILVRRPEDPDKFNGTVIVEWANVSAGFDIGFSDPESMYEEVSPMCLSLPRWTELRGWPMISRV